MLHTTWLPLIACMAVLAAPCDAEEAPAAPTPAPAAQAPAAAPAPAAQPDPGETAPAATPPPREIDRLVTRLADEHRELEAEGVRFPVFHRAASAPARGAVVLVPGDGEYPTADAALAQLREQLPAFGWSIWLIGLERPPRIHVSAREPASGNAPAGESPLPAEPPAPAPQPPVDPSAVATTSTPAAEQQRIEELQAWAKRATARLAATVAAAAGEGKVVLIAEGIAAPLLLAQLAAAPASAHAVVLIEPLAPPGLVDAWPSDFTVPVLEVLGAAMQHEQGAAFRARAAALPSYRQLRLDDPGKGPYTGEAPLVRRLRGWLLSLER